MKKVSHKYLLVIFLLIIIVLMLIKILQWVVYEAPYRNMTESEIVTQGINKIQMGNSYSFNMKAVETKENQSITLADLAGEVYQGNARVEGTMPFINAEINLIRANQQLYRKDSLDNRWVKIPIEGIDNMESFMMEINPLGAFSFLESMDVNYTGKEKVNGRLCRVYEVMTRGEHQWLTYFWRDYNYRIWIDQKEGYMKKGVVLAEHRDDSLHTLHITVDLLDYGKKINIKAPEAAN